MRARTRSNATKIGCLLLGLVLTLDATTAEARTRRTRKRSAAPKVLQPFLLLRSAVHAVAEPIVFDAPRAVMRAAITPARLASRKGRERIYEPRGAETIDEDETDWNGTPAADVRLAAANYDRPMRVAYIVPRSGAVPPPRAEPAEEDSEDAIGEPVDRAPEIAQSGSRPTVAGHRALLRGGVAYAPANAPQRVKNAIWAANSLRRKPYVWGGGHSSFRDRGYDCSGTVSFALHHAGALAAPLPSSDFMRYGERGRGRWITIYSRRGHTFATIAGLRLDTTDFENGGNTGPHWHAEMRDTRGYVARHPAGM